MTEENKLETFPPCESYLHAGFFLHKLQVVFESLPQWLDIIHNIIMSCDIYRQPHSRQSILCVKVHTDVYRTRKIIHANECGINLKNL